MLVDGYGNGEDDPVAVVTFSPDRAVEIAESLLRFARQAKEANEQPAAKPIEVKNLNGIGLKLDRIQTTISDCCGEHKGNDEIILYVSEYFEYDTDFIQDDCAMLHFSPTQARMLASRLWKLAVTV